VFGPERKKFRFQNNPWFSTGLVRASNPLGLLHYGCSLLDGKNASSLGLRTNKFVNRRPKAAAKTPSFSLSNRLPSGLAAPTGLRGGNIRGQWRRSQRGQRNNRRKDCGTMENVSPPLAMVRRAIRLIRHFPLYGNSVKRFRPSAVSCWPGLRDGKGFLSTCSIAPGRILAKGTPRWPAAIYGAGASCDVAELFRRGIGIVRHSLGGAEKIQ